MTWSLRQAVVHVGTPYPTKVVKKDHYLTIIQATGSTACPVIVVSQKIIMGSFSLSISAVECASSKSLISTE